MANITMPDVTHHTENHKGFVISWQEPPMTGGIWSADIATDSPQLLSLMGRNGAAVIQAQTRDAMLGKAREHIDRLLSQ